MAEFIRIAERLVLLMLSALVIVRLLPSLSFHPQIILVLASEIIGVFLILVQRRGTWSTSSYATAISFVGTGAALCVAPTGRALAPEYVSAALIFAGTLISLAAKLSLRRSFGLIPANRGVKKRGAYSFVRHPMYTGYVINHIGFLMVFFSDWNIAVYLVAWVLLYLRAMEEEKFLRADPEYVDYTKKVKARIIPGLI